MDLNAFGDWVWSSLVNLVALAPLGTAVAAVVAVVALAQKWHADRRSAWWDRVRWAVDHTLGGEDDARLVGIEAIRAIQGSRAPNKADKKILQAVADWVVDDELDEGILSQDNGGTASAPEGDS